MQSSRTPAGLHPPARGRAGLYHPGVRIQVVQAAPQLLVLLQCGLKLPQRRRQPTARAPAQLQRHRQVCQRGGRRRRVARWQGQAQLVAPPSGVGRGQGERGEVVGQGGHVAPAQGIQFRLQAGKKRGRAGGGCGDRSGAAQQRGGAAHASCRKLCPADATCCRCAWHLLALHPSVPAPNQQVNPSNEV